MGSAAHHVDSRPDTTVEADHILADNARLRAEIAALRERIGELEHLADTDTLTPLPNRRAFVRELQRMVKRVDRHGTSAVLMFVDVDGLKVINDAWGHGAGDAAIQHVAAALRRGLRESDMVARIGGDEFGLLLDPLDEAAAAAKAHALRAAVSSEPLNYAGRAIDIRLSIGFARLEPNDVPDAVIARADTHMYQAKASQRSVR